MGNDDYTCSHVTTESALGHSCTLLAAPGRVLNKKRSYAQFFLDLGQSDFSLRTCGICGMKYTPGDEEDENTHKEVHKNYISGVPFKGYKNERVVDTHCAEGGRVVLVLDTDPTSHRKKVQEVIRMMEVELGDGWIFHEFCKVYLFVSSSRVSGCVVAEAVSEAFKVIPPFTDSQTVCKTAKNSKPVSKALKFGDVVLQREIIRKQPADNSQNSGGSIVCEQVPVIASCGIRAIWVTPSNRRKGIARHLLDAVRNSFCPGVTVKECQLAFSPPTSAGKALASSYTGTTSFLVYKPQNDRKS